MQILQNVKFVKNSFTCLSHMTCKIRKMFNKLAMVNVGFCSITHILPGLAGCHSTSSCHHPASSPAPSCDIPAGRPSYPGSGTVIELYMNVDYKSHTCIPHISPEDSKIACVHCNIIWKQGKCDREEVKMENYRGLNQLRCSPGNGLHKQEASFFH